MFDDIIFKNINDVTLEHPIEKRGFVQVPLDYSQGCSPNINIFYRMIPAYGSHINDKSKPIIVVMNGGPGAPSSVYRSLDFDYSKPNPNIFDRFKYLLINYRILLVDQRGTDGLSVPIDFTNRAINPYTVSRLFSSDSQAKDYLAVIEHCISPQEPFFILGQSYGGLPAMQYLGLKNSRKPSGLILSSASLPYENFKDMLLWRRHEQLMMNQQLQKKYPHIPKLILNLRTHFNKLKLNPVKINGLYDDLGNGAHEKWEDQLLHKIEAILDMDRNSIEKLSSFNLGEVNLLNYILSSSNVTPGYTDRTLSDWTSNKIPFESWMLDENQLYSSINYDQTWISDYVRKIDLNPPKPILFPSETKLRQKILKQKVLFTCAEDDVFVPMQGYLNSLKKFYIEDCTTIEILKGGHHAIFLEQGHQVLNKWIEDVGY